MSKKLAGILILACGAAAATSYAAAPRDSYEVRNRDMTTASAPEIDPASAFSALTLLGASVAVLRGRRRK